ncbi:Translin [Lentinula aff. lateritia]|uniref:Translin n=1 Tax=Lentinula aff. lateritia TaxID=2804960 RepID=A0ACC1U4Y9_9AGAR|nr:Translin [Lentinula aff. lateritia]
MSSSIHNQFLFFRESLDDYHDRRERLIKASRDITNISKKTIFLLHRLALEAQDASERADASKIGLKKLTEVQKLYADMRDELAGDEYWRYERQVSPGLQEYIEALSFAHFLEHGGLITYEQAQATLCGTDGIAFFPLTISDYLLGVSDLTGELMRFAISGFGRPGGRARALETCIFVRNCKSGGFTPYVWELHKKQAVTAQSLSKIEDAAYTAVVRTSEFDLPAEMLDDIVNQTVLDYSNNHRNLEREVDDQHSRFLPSSQNQYMYWNEI